MLDWSNFSKLNSVHFNDSQTALAPIELFRILLDEELLPWEEVFRIVKDSCTFTQHSIHSARDYWPCNILQKVLPRHLDLIFKINFFLIQEFEHKVDKNTLREISLVEEGPVK